MPIDYAAVLNDLQAHGARLTAELEHVHQSESAIRMLLGNHSNPETLPYSALGTTAAIRDLIGPKDAMTRDEIYAKLKERGWASGASNPLASLGATLSQLGTAGELEKVNDRWRKTRKV